MDHHYDHNSLTSVLSRTASEDTVCLSNVNSTTSRRTRKRFTKQQLVMLEDLFHRNSHPSREDREAVAKAGGMEIKSVTIWFQNKRQTERKSAAGNYSSLNIPPFTHQPPPPSRRTSSPTLTNRSTLAASLRPSLDRVASRSELRAPAPRTPSKRLDPSATLWDNMPSSPITDPNSPPAREYVEFGKKRTLEWACAAARLAEKDGARPGIGSAAMSRPGSRTRTRERLPTKLDLEITDDEDEIITPPGTLGECDSRWTSDPRGDGAIITFPSSHVNEPLKKHTDEDDDEIMKAALALCGLQNRRAL